MAFRKHHAGEIVVEQTRDLARLRSVLEAGGMITEGIEWPQACYILAFDGDDAIGSIGVECCIDAALVRSLFVNESYRRRGIGAALVAAARKAAHTRGARELYLFAYPELTTFFERQGFARTTTEFLMQVLAEAPEVSYYRARPDELANELAFHLDISKDGVIER